MGDFLIVIGKRDAERFRRFRTGYDADIIKNITKLSNAENIWALGPAVNDNLWSAIQKNDRIFFAERGFSFTRCGIVSKKTISQTQAIKIWGDSPRMREHKRLILFSSVYEIDILFHRLCKEKADSSNTATSVYPSTDKAATVVPDSLEHKITGTIIVSDDGAPNKKTEVVTRFLRDTKKVRQLKTIYHDECQICGHTIYQSPKSRYSEVHHLYPLKDGGDDDFDNMLVLCPNHHVAFDYKVIGIDKDRKTIIDMNRKHIGKLTLYKEHKLNMKNILFHMNGMKKNEL